MLTLKNDIIFKAVYAREDKACKQALIAVLNLILDRRDDPITSISYRNPFNIREQPDQKESILDIKAETTDGELLNLEIHLVYDPYFINRNIYYQSGIITQSLESGETYDKIKKTISIYIVDFSLFRKTDQFHCCFMLKEVRENFLLTDLLQMHYLELPKVNPGHRRQVSQLTELERYLEYLRYAGDPEEAAYVAELKSQGGKEIAMTETLLKKATADEIIREQAISRDKFRMQQRHQKQYIRMLQEEAEMAQEETEKAQEDARQAQAEAKQAQEEAKQAQEETMKAQEEAAAKEQAFIKKMYASGISLTQISEITEFPETVLKKLLNR